MTMKRLTRVGLGLVAALLTGCAAAPESAPGTAGSAAATPATSPPEASAATQPAAGPSFLSIVGTPFLIAFKIPLCIITIAVAAPLAGLSELPGTADTEGRDMRRQLEIGINQNCGPPFVVTP